MQARYSLFRPGGPIALMLASNPTVLQIDHTIFAHGGIHENALDYGFERLNRDVSDWFRGAVHRPPQLVLGAQGVVWTRAYGSDCRCGATQELLEKCGKASPMCLARKAGRNSFLFLLVLLFLGASRLVVGHTPQQQGLNSCCNGMDWRIDVGMSSGMMGSTPQVIEITEGGKNVQVLSAEPVFPQMGNDNSFYF